jgi:RNase P subunit RPR2
VPLSYSLRGEFKAQSYGYKICYEQYGVEGDTRYLKFLFNLMADLVENYLQVLAWGGEAVPALQAIVTSDNHVLKSIAVQLLRDIGADTTYRLGRQAEELFCPRCLTHFAPQTIRLSWWQSVIYCGCRTCGQSRETLHSERLVALLDNDIALEAYNQNGNLHVNWLKRRHVFDFDRVAIIHATDEDVERFAVQVGNDTDLVRKPRYTTMPCVVSAECHLSENSIRILERMFGKVVVTNHAGA